MPEKMSPYAALLSRLLSINMQGMKLGLQNPWHLDRLTGSPSQAFDSIHIAGSNGKGSVSAKIAAGLEQARVKTGLYTSPHLACFRERICINRQMIAEEELQKQLQALFEIIDEHTIPATFFELTTALAFSFFAEKKVEMAVVEAGLGGRLDATNILKPKLSIITSISLEHTEFLGSTLEAIAKEKCGIIKPGIPILIGPRVPEQIVREQAALCRSPVIRVEGAFSDYHEENRAIARRALELLQVDPEAIRQGLEALPPCRLEIFTKKNLKNFDEKTPSPKAVVFDVAHNPDGFFQLLKALKKRFPKEKLRFLIGMSKNKDMRSCFKLLRECNAPMHLVEAQSERAASREVLREICLELGMPTNR